MHRRAGGRVGFLRVDNEGQGLVFDFHEFGGVLGQGARIGDDGGDPFAHVARGADRERVATHVRRIQPVHQGFAGRGEFRAVDPGFQQTMCHMMDLPVEAVVDAAMKLLAES